PHLRRDHDRLPAGLLAESATETFFAQAEAVVWCAVEVLHSPIECGAHGSRSVSVRDFAIQISDGTGTKAQAANAIGEQLSLRRYQSNINKHHDGLLIYQSSIKFRPDEASRGRHCIRTLVVSGARSLPADERARRRRETAHEVRRPASGPMVALSDRAPRGAAKFRAEARREVTRSCKSERERDFRDRLAPLR